MEGKYPHGEQLPSEKNLCATYSASRGTVRKALELLEEEGLVNILHGKGVFILKNDLIDFSFGQLVSFGEACESNKIQVHGTNVKSFNQLIIDNGIGKFSNLPAGKVAYEIHRIRSVENENLIHDINYFLSDVVTGLTKEIAGKSIYSYIEHELNIEIGFARKSIKVEAATKKDKEYLDMKQFEYVAVVRNYVYLKDGTQFEYTESRHRQDYFVFTDFVRRR